MFQKPNLKRSLADIRLIANVYCEFSRIVTIGATTTPPIPQPINISFLGIDLPS